MPEPPEQSLASAPAPAAAVLNTTARWLGIDEDIALGCESADPALQIDRWGQEVLPFPAA
jgi:hypothetical protein